MRPDTGSPLQLRYWLIRAFALAMAVLLAGATCSWSATAQSYKVLVFSKTAAFRHTSIDEGIAAIKQLGTANGFDVVDTEDAGAFTGSNLAQYRAVVFLSTTGDVLSDAQQAAFEDYIEAGGGWVGIHAASDTEYGWPWYGGLVGAYFKDHPTNPVQATIKVEDRSHPSTAHLEATWQRTDEWYSFQSNPRGAVDVLMALDETTYIPKTRMGDHPIAWYHLYDGGRAWYTALGHTEASFTSDTAFLAHILGGIQWAAERPVASPAPSPVPSPTPCPTPQDSPTVEASSTSVPSEPATPTATTLPSSTAQLPRRCLFLPLMVK